MGWTYEPAPGLTRARRADVERYVTERVATWFSPERGEGARVLASAMVGATWYGAVERYGKAGRQCVFGMIVRTRRVGRAQDGYNFGIKSMCEEMGPVEADAPMRVIAKLDPTTDQNALEWRQRCIDNCRRRREGKERGQILLREGALVRLPEPVRFSDGASRQKFIVWVRAPRTFIFKCRDTGVLCRLSPTQRRMLVKDDQAAGRGIDMAA